MNLKETCDKIKSIKIQGAENVTTAALQALENTVIHSQAKTKAQLLKELNTAKQQLFQTRSTEPEMRNYTTQVIQFTKSFPERDIQHLKHATKENIKHTLVKKQERKERIIKIGSIFLIKERKEKKLRVYTHCHASSVTAILKQVSKRKKITVSNTETRPLLQGRKTAQELAKAGIAVTHHVDAAMISAIQEADLVLIGADAITKEGVYNKIGSELVALLSSHYHKPLYVCASIWKYDEKKEHIEQRAKEEVWGHIPKGVSIHNPAFEKIHWKHITAVISEEGILKPKSFVKRAKSIVK